jgi:hypothetical protein
LKKDPLFCGFYALCVHRCIADGTTPAPPSAAALLLAATAGAAGYLPGRQAGKLDTTTTRATDD